MNIMDIIKPYLNQELIQKAAAWLGESESGVSKALAATLPTLMGSVLSKAEQRGFVDTLSGLVSNPALKDADVLKDASSLFSASAVSGPAGQIGGFGMARVSLQRRIKGMHGRRRIHDLQRLPPPRDGIIGWCGVHPSDKQSDKQKERQERFHARDANHL